MQQATFKYHIDGLNADKVSERLIEIISRDLGFTPELLNALPADETIETDSRIQSLASFVLSIPGTALDAENLFDRIKKRRQLDTLHQHTLTMLQQHAQVNIQIEKPDGTLVALNDADSTDLLA